MNLSKPIVSIAVISILILGSLSLFAAPARAVSTQTVDISSAVSGSAQWITYDSANSLAFISVGVSQNNLYKVNLATVLVQGASAVTGYPSIFGNSACTGFGSLANGLAATTIIGGNLYGTYWCSSNAIGVAQIRESDGAVLNTWTYSGPTDAQGLVTDGTQLYVCAQGKILSLTTSGTYSLLHTISNDCVNLILVGSTLWFSEGSSGIGKINTDGTGFSEVGCGGCSTAYFLASQGSNIFFTDSAAHNLIKYDGASFTSYATGLSSTGPYGLGYDSAKNRLIVQGWANNNILAFDLTANTFSTLATTSKKPFQGFIDSLNNVWNMALGSTDLIYIPASSTTTTTTTSSSSSSTTTTTSSVTTDASGCVIGTKCAGSWTPIVIPTIHISSVGRVCQITANGTICSPNTTISGFEFFLSGPSSGDFMQWVALVGCCAYELSSLNPSNGTFATMSVRATPYAPNWYSQTPAPLVNALLTPTSETKFGWFCNNDHIVDYIIQCDGSALPVSYRTFAFTVPTQTIVTIQATGTQSDGQAFVYNIFT